jgi:hypothetical protein
MSRAVSWRTIANEGWVARARHNWYHNSDSKLDIAFFLRQGKHLGTTNQYPKLMIVGFKNNKIDRNNVILSINCDNSWRAKDFVDHILALAYAIEKNGAPVESVVEWIKMQMRLIDTHKSTEILATASPSYYRNWF